MNPTFNGCPVSSGYIATGVPVLERKSNPPCSIPSVLCEDDDDDNGSGIVGTGMDDSSDPIVVVSGLVGTNVEVVIASVVGCVGAVVVLLVLPVTNRF